MFSNFVCGFACVGSYEGGLMYPVALCLGAGLAAITVAVATLLSELLGDDTASVGFVIVLMSATDKLVVGIAVLGVPAEAQLNAQSPGNVGANFHRNSLGVVPLVCVGATRARLFPAEAAGREKGGAAAAPPPR